MRGKIIWGKFEIEVPEATNANHVLFQNVSGQFEIKMRDSKCWTFLIFEHKVQFHSESFNLEF